MPISKNPILKDYINDKLPEVIRGCSHELYKTDEEKKRLLLLVNRAMAYLELDLYKHCIKDALEATKIDSSWLRPQYLMIRALIGRGKKKTATDIYEMWREKIGLGELALQKEIHNLLYTKPQTSATTTTVTTTTTTTTENLRNTPAAEDIPTTTTTTTTSATTENLRNTPAAEEIPTFDIRGM